VIEHSEVTLNASAAILENAVNSRRISPIELLHPDGFAQRSLVIGSNCLPLLLPESCTKAGEGADLVLLAPTAAECRTSGWLENATKILVQKLAADGLAYVLVSPRWRPRIKRLLYRYGLRIERPIAHLPNLASSRYLVPINPVPARYAFSKLIASRPWVRRLAMMAFCIPSSERLLGSMLSSVGFAARFPGARPLFNWLFQLDGNMGQPRSVVISLSWRGQDGPVVLHRFSGDSAHPLAIAKMALTPAMAINRVREARVLSCLGPTANSAGAQVPQFLLSGQIGGHPVLLETAISGQRIATVLPSRPNRLLECIEKVVYWLEQWNRATIVIESLTYERLNRELLAPAALLAPLLHQGEEYRDWLTERCAIALGTPMPHVATHNDLTMWNVLLDEQGRIGVVDWEMGVEKGFAMVDFFYAVTDAVAAVEGYTDRLRAFEACFAQGGAWAHVVAHFQNRLSRIIQIPADMADLCFHACWLHHAANEHRSSKNSNPKPFLKIMQWVTSHRS
jgi:hypothetical protein